MKFLFMIVLLGFHQSFAETPREPKYEYTLKITDMTTKEERKTKHRRQAELKGMQSTKIELFCAKGISCSFIMGPGLGSLPESAQITCAEEKSKAKFSTDIICGDSKTSRLVIEKGTSTCYMSVVCDQLPF